MNDVPTLLRQAAPEPASDDFADLGSIVHRARTRRARRLVGRTIGGVAVSVVVVAAALSLAHLRPTGGHSEALGTPSSHFTALPPPSHLGGGSIPGAGRPLIELFDPSQDLLPGGHVASVDEASRLVSYQMYLPGDAALPPPEVWVVRYNDENGEPAYDAAVRYDASVVITYGVWTNDRDPAAEYRKMYADTPAGYLTTINGNPAWVVPAGSPHTVDPRIGVVELSIGHVEVVLYGRVPVEDLIQYASTLQAV